MRYKTHGLSPKVLAAVTTAVITYVLTQTLVTLPLTIEVVGQALLIAVTTYAANPGKVSITRKRKVPSEHR